MFIGSRLAQRCIYGLFLHRKEHHSLHVCTLSNSCAAGEAISHKTQDLLMLMLNAAIALEDVAPTTAYNMLRPVALVFRFVSPAVRVTRSTPENARRLFRSTRTRRAPCLQTGASPALCE